MTKRYNTPHRSRVVKTRLSEDEYERFDLRSWNEDYTVPFKGLTFSEDEATTLLKALSNYVPKQYINPLHVTDMGKTKAKIYYVIAELSFASVDYRNIDPRFVERDCDG